MSSNDTNPTNESNEAYERRIAIKELMSAPQGTQFQLSVDGKNFSNVETPNWNFYNYTYRIAPVPKKVLRPVGEILDEALRRKQLTVVKNVVSIIDNRGLVWYIGDLLTQVVVEKNAPDWFFTTEEPTR